MKDDVDLSGIYTPLANEMERLQAIRHVLGIATSEGSET